MPALFSSSSLSLLLLLLLLSSQLCFSSALSHTTVKFLPGFHGPLPFHLETGKWLTAHPEFQSNPIYVAGDSYSGKIVPSVALEISKGNEKSIEPSMNLQGYVLGNPSTDDDVENNYKIPVAHGLGLISDELYEALKSSCKGEYQNVDPRNEMCVGYIAEYEKCVSGINKAHILETKCPFLSPKAEKLSDIRRRRSLNEIPETSLPSDPQPSLPTITCRLYGALLAQYWANDASVRKALGIRQGSTGKWIRCISTPYTKEIKSSVPFHVALSAKGYPSLIYSGDHDLLVPFRGTEAWIRSLNSSIIDEWRPWLVEGQVAGYTRTYSNGITYATVKGGGHTAPEYKPKECFAMFERWISQKPL